jgi:long-chain fatty acid transport protein
MLITCLAVLVLGPVLALANGFYSPTAGTRASAMGGAFVGLADDYSAVYWNPAGITQINGMEVTVTGADVLSLASRDGIVEYEGFAGADDDFRYAIGTVGVTSDGLNKIAPGFFFYTDAGPLRNVVDKVGLTAYTLTEYGTKWNGGEVLDEFVGHASNYDAIFFGGDRQDYSSRIKTYVVSPVVAKEVFPGLSVGLTANIAYSHMTIENVLMIEQPFPVETPDIEDDWWLALTPLQVTDDVTATGYGATVGLLYRATSQVSAGLTVRSPMTLSYDGTFGLMASGGGEVFEEKHKSDFEIKYPLWVGAGFAYRDFVFDGLTLTGDLQWTDWSTVEGIDRNITWASSSEIDEGGQELFATTPLDWEDTIEIAVGFDYRLGRSLVLDLGYRNSPTPAPDETYDFVLPQTDKNVIAGGVTYLQDFWRASLAIEYHAGDERNIPVSANEDMRGKHVEDLFIPSLSFTYAF